MRDETDNDLERCNRLYGSSRCRRSVSGGKCPAETNGEGKLVCIGRQKENH